MSPKRGWTVSRQRQANLGAVRLFKFSQEQEGIGATSTKEQII